MILLQWRYKYRYGVKKTASRLFTRPFFEVHIKENIKAPRHCMAFVRGRHLGPVNPPNKVPVAR